MAKHSTPRVPIQTPMFDAAGNLTRTWIIFFERLKQIEAGPDLEEATFVIYDTAVGSNVTNLLPVQRGGTAVMADIVPKMDVTADFTFDILITRAGEDFATHRDSIFGTDKLTVPGGTDAGTVITQEVFVSDPFVLEVDDVLSSDILDSDGTGVYTIVLRWTP